MKIDFEAVMGFQNVSVNRNILLPFVSVYGKYFIFVESFFDFISMDKNKLFGILNDWNYWDKPVPEFFPRPLYQEKINQYLTTGEVIVLKGIRRAGKSTLLINHIRYLTENGIDKKAFLFVNFEDPRLGDEPDSELLEQILETYKEFVNHEVKPHVFLDEVQNVHQWEKWVLTGYELDRGHFYVTGSSSKLLSREFGTALSGRFLAINVLPLGFDEYLLFKNLPAPDKNKLITQKILYKKAFNDYLTAGGFPKAVSLVDDLRRQEMIMYYETIILKDIVARYNLKNFDSVKKVALFLLSNIGKPFNLNKVKTTLQLSYDLADKYFEYLKDTFLLFEIYKYDHSLNKQFANRRKVHCIDNGILSAISFRVSEDYGRYLENIVFVELMRREKDIYFHQGQKECDFVIKESLRITQVIQVCRSLKDEKTRQREIDGLLEAIKTYNLNDGLILTEDEDFETEADGFKINVQPVWKWFLQPDIRTV
ncbi:MAG: ATP-binding protein [Bacteroidales bacterium]|nr:ATP-binding protein [Bacteroidales bacterium]